jgi:hypothetical protein
MPNIELHGFGDKNSINAKEMREKVFSLFLGKEEILKEIVVTIYSNDVQDYKGNAQPFIRVVTTPGHDHIFIVGRLRFLNVDIEVGFLEYFYPKT